MKFTFVATILAATALTVTPVMAQKKPAATPTRDATASGTVAATGPKVHTSQARDVTSCSRTVNGGGDAAVGLALGGLLGSKVGGGSTGVLAGSAIGGVAGTEIEKKRRCGPDADIESNAASDPAPRKKRGIGGLRNALGL